MVRYQTNIITQTYQRYQTKTVLYQRYQTSFQEVNKELSLNQQLVVEELDENLEPTCCCCTG